MSKTGSLEDLHMRRQYAAEWFDLALCNAEAAIMLAEHPRVRCQSLFLTQQSMEAATKGFARNAGLPHNKLRAWSHNNPNLFLWCVDAIIESAEITEHIRSVFSTGPYGERESDVILQLKSLLEKTADPSKARKMGVDKEETARNYFAFVLTLPPDGIATLLKLLDQVKGSITEQRRASEPLMAKITEAPIPVQELSAGANVVTTITPQIILHCQRRMPNVKITGAKLNLVNKLIRQFLEESLKEMGEEQFRTELKANKGRISLDKNKIMAGSFDVPLGILSTFILGTIVWPHGSYPRYIGSSDRNMPFEVAAANRTVGFQHYSEDVGVISYIQELAGRAHAVTKSLSKAYKIAWLT